MFIDFYCVFLYQRYFFVVTDYWDNSGIFFIVYYCFQRVKNFLILIFFFKKGFVIDVLAKDMGAAVYFVEHRYFGESMPYGNDSFKGSNIGYLRFGLNFFFFFFKKINYFLCFVLFQS